MAWVHGEGNSWARPNYKPIFQEEYYTDEYNPNNNTDNSLNPIDNVEKISTSDLKCSNLGLSPSDTKYYGFDNVVINSVTGAIYSTSTTAGNIYLTVKLDGVTVSQIVRRGINISFDISEELAFLKNKYIPYNGTLSFSLDATASRGAYINVSGYTPDI